MRSTLTLDDDVVAKVKSEARRGSRPLRVIANDTLRWGLANRRAAAQRQCLKVATSDLGDLKRGLSLGNVAELIEHVEGTLYR
jgi:hypothetical protein